MLICFDLLSVELPSLFDFDCILLDVYCLLLNADSCCVGILEMRCCFLVVACRLLL